MWDRMARGRAGRSEFQRNALNNAPTFKLDLSPEYDWSVPRGTLALRGEAHYSTRFYFTPSNIDLLSQGPYAKVNGFLTDVLRYDDNPDQRASCITKRRRGHT